MKKITLAFVLGSVFLAGCPKHEIIPAPEPRVALDPHFIGTINGSSVELTGNVLGYFLDADKIKYVLPAPALSSAVYYADMKSDQTNVSIKISVGSVNWDASLSDSPPQTTFNSFCSALTSISNPPVYSDDAAAGFEVTYRDGDGFVWKTDETSTPQDVLFHNVIQESDGTGDYTKFVCTFNCVVYRMTAGPTPTLLSLPIENAEFTGWFKR